MKLILQTKHQEIEGVYSFVFEPQEPISWQPGQYMHYVLEHDADERGKERWFTIASAPYEKHIQITTRFDGERQSSFKQTLQAMEPGAEIEADGPKGSFVIQPGDHQQVFIAGGIGITPYRSMLAQMLHDMNIPKIDLLYANHDVNVVFGDELKRISAENSSFRIIEFVDKRIEEPDLQEYLKDGSSIFYLSGPRSMVESYAGLLASNNIGEDRVMTDYFPGYK